MADYNARPEFIFSENALLVKTRWYIYEVEALLKRDSRLTRAEVWNMPTGEGAWWLAAMTEAAGEKIDLVTPEDHAQLKEMGLE